MLVIPGDWAEQALCTQTDPEAFYPNQGQSPQRAKAICTLCPVENSCLEFALRNNENFGVWGGCSEREREVLRKKRQ
jgi:WhiB family transcriptional regulator, redox-sensing transcriptional regulator